MHHNYSELRWHFASAVITLLMSNRGEFGWLRMHVTIACYHLYLLSQRSASVRSEKCPRCCAFDYGGSDFVLASMCTRIRYMLKHHVLWHIEARGHMILSCRLCAYAQCISEAVCFFGAKWLSVDTHRHSWISMTICCAIGECVGSGLFIFCLLDGDLN